MIESLLAKKQESDIFDIKLQFYDDAKKFELIKDIVAFANCREISDKYIIFGVEDRTFKIKGFSGEFPDISDIQNLLKTYVEPSVDIEIGCQIINGFDVKFIKIKNCINKPYVIKKNYSKNGKIELREGEIYIRKNATNSLTTRDDLIQMFKEKEGFSVVLKNTWILAKSVLLLVEIRNEKNISIKITNAFLRIISEMQEFIVSKCFIYDNNRKLKNKLCIDKNNSLNINSNSNREEWLYFEIDEKVYQILKENKGLNILLNFRDTNELNMDIKVEI